MRTFVLAGQVVSQTSNSEVPGLTIRVVFQEVGRGPISTLTNEEGSFHVILEENDVRDGEQIAVVAHSDVVEELVTPKSSVVRVNLGTQTNIRISVDEELSQKHLQRTVTLKPTEGRLFPRVHLQYIYSAVNLYGDTTRKYSIDGPGSPGLTCRLPEMNDLDDLMLDCWEAGLGNPYAAERLQNTLDIVAIGMTSRGSTPPRIDFEGEEWKRYVEERRLHPHKVNRSHPPMIPLERIALLMAAAKIIAGKDARLANRNMNIVMGQLIEFFRAAPIYRTSQSAVLGDGIARREVRRMVGIWGEECTGRRPVPDDFPVRDPLEGMDNALEPELDNILPCLADMIRVRAYRIDSIIPLNGCAGDTATITGTGFGTVAGKVMLPGSTWGSTIDVEPDSWTDTQVDVTIPPEATYGRVALSFPMRRGVTACGILTSERSVDVSAEPTIFTGGLPGLNYITFYKNFTAFDPALETVVPGDFVTFTYGTPPNVPQHDVKINVAAIDPSTGQFGQEISALDVSDTFPLPSPPGNSVRLDSIGVPLDRSSRVTCLIDLSNDCGTSHHSFHYLVHRPATVSLTGIEVTQVTQFFRANEHMHPDSGQTNKQDNSVRLVARKPTLARVYYTTNQASSFDEGRTHGLQVKLTARRGEENLDEAICMNADNLFASEDNSVRNDRGNIRRSANFLLPSNWTLPSLQVAPGVGLPTVRPLELTATLSINPVIPWFEDKVSPSANTLKVKNLHFHGARRLKIVLIRYTVNMPADGTFPRPSLDNCVRFLENVAGGLPTHAVEVFLPNSISQQRRTIDADLLDVPSGGTGGCGTGWNALMDSLRDIREDIVQEEQAVIAESTDEEEPVNLDEMIWTGIVADTIPMDIGGCGSTDRTATFPVNLITTGMHEYSHVCGQDHVRDDPNFPSYRGPADTDSSCGEFGVALVDINPDAPVVDDITVFDPDVIRDVMGVRRTSMPFAGRWMSPYAYGALTDDFLRTNGQGAVTSEISDPATRNYSMEQLVVRGTIDRAADEVALRPIFHERRPLLSARGTKSPYVIVVADGRGRAVHREVIRVDSRSPRTFRFFCLIPFSAEIASIEIKKQGVVLKRVERRRQSPRVIALRMESRGTTRSLSWDVDGVDEHWCCVQLTCDGGTTWTRLTQFEGITSFTFDESEVGGGSECRIRVSVTDGFNTAFADTDPFSLPMRPPEIVVLGIPEDRRVLADQPYTVRAVPVYTLGVPHRTELVWLLDGEEIKRGSRASVKFGPGAHELRVVPEGFEQAGIVVEISTISPEDVA